MDKEKYVDESWKEQAIEEKDKLNDTVVQETASSEASQTEGETQTAPESHGEDRGCAEHAQDIEINFLNYITSLGFQAMIFLGEIPNPVTNEVEKNLAQAKFLIDTLSMLNEKTAGNLDDQEKNLLENSIHELQMRYVEHVQKGASSQGEKSA
ncbi:MAG: DUF1844 domain-containing protein [Candidatus Omnitrophica bacterium]|nr:DUF1844 domain-containing protein [Candidatus Omnitrophota bacterium]